MRRVMLLARPILSIMVRGSVETGLRLVLLPAFDAPSSAYSLRTSLSLRSWCVAPGLSRERVVESGGLALVCGVSQKI